MKSGWKETTLGEVVEFQRGFDLPIQNRTTGKYPLVVSNGIDGFVDEYKVKGPGVITGRSGTLGKVFFIEGNFWPLNTTLWIKDFKCNDEKFIYYWLLNFPFEKFNAGSGVPTLNRNHIHPTPVTVPESITEQKAIAAVLSSFDDKIELLRRQNKTLESIAHTIFKQSFVKDESWDGNLSEYLKVQGGYAFKGEDFKEVGFAGIIKITNITMGVIDISNSQFVDENIVTDIDEDKFRIHGGDFLIAMTGAEIGKIGIVEETKRQIWLNQRVGKLISKVPYGDLAGYLALRSREGQEHIINAAAGSAQANISSSGIEEMAFAPYSEKVTNSFGEKVKPLFEKITFNLFQIQTLSKLRNLLLPKLMRGKMRVKID